MALRRHRGGDVPAVIDEIRTTFGASEQFSFYTNRAIRDRIFQIFDQTFAITRALTLLALIVASVGLYNALLALENLPQITISAVNGYALGGGLEAEPVGGLGAGGGYELQWPC